MSRIHIFFFLLRFLFSKNWSVFSRAAIILDLGVLIRSSKIENNFFQKNLGGVGLGGVKFESEKIVSKVFLN